MSDLTASEQNRLGLARSLDAETSQPSKRETRRMSPRKRLNVTGKHTLLVVLSLLTLAPIVLLISTTFKTGTDVKVDPFGLFTSFSFDNIVKAWTDGHFSDYVLNSVLLSVPATLLVIVLSTMAGYAFARLPFPGRTLAFYTVVLGLLVPFFTYMIPLFFQLRSIGLLDTLGGVILVLTSTGVSFGTFFMRAFFTDLPNELEQAARIDGASEWQIFYRVMLPLVGSGISALAVFTFLQTWNNFLVPLLYLPGGDFRPLTTGLYQFTSGRELDIGPLAAATLITILPVLVLFVVMQKQVAQGFISGAVKG
jgi:ABC-type glycerol-3-phosphate transport system permease component